MDIFLKFGNLDKMKILSSEPKLYLGISGKGLITSMGLNIIIRPNKIKKAMFVITEFSLNYIFKIIKEVKDVPYEGYVTKSSKHMATDNYFYLSSYIANFITSNSRGLVRTHKKSTQNISNSHVCSKDENKSKRINANKI